MDKDKAVIIDRFIQAISLHGPQLVNDAKNAHGDVDGSTMDFLVSRQSNIDSTNYFNHRLHQVLYTEYPMESSRMEPDFQERIRKFIASKSDLLFSLKGREELRRGIDYGLDNNHEVLDLYSKVPPLEVFMGIPTHVKRWQLFKVMKEDDIVLGEVVSKRPFGIFVKLTALEFSKNRDFTDTNIEALCRTLDLDDKDTHREHKDPADGFLIGDHVRGVITSVNIEEERIAISFKSSKLPEQHQHLHLGLLEDFDSTKESHYDSSESKSYMEHLSSHVGLNNPKNIETLIDILGVDTQQPCSLLRSFQRCNYPEEEYLDVLRKKQSAKWSMESTAKGIELFKAGDINTALKYLEHALQIHGENVEALVARGALSANEGKYSTAVNDFRQALSINQNHKNATKYLVQTLIEQGIQQEKNGQLTEASHSLSEAIALNPDQPTAKEHLEKIKEKLSIKRQKEEKSRQEDESLTSKFSHVRQLIEEEQIRKKKKKKKDKKKKKKQRVEKKNKKTRRRTRTRSDTDNSLTASESPYESENKKNSENIKGENDRAKMQTNQRNEKELCENISHSTISDEKDSQSRKGSKDAMISRVHQRKRSRSTTSTGSNYSGSNFSDNRSTDEGLRRLRDHSRSRKLSHRDKRSRSSGTRSSRSRSSSADKRTAYRSKRSSRDHSRSRKMSHRDKRSRSTSTGRSRSSSDKGTSNRSKRRSREKTRSRKMSHRDKRSRSTSTGRSRSSSSEKRTANRSKRRSRDHSRSRKLSHRDKRSRSTSTGSTRSRSRSSDEISANRSKKSRKQFHSSIK